MKYRLNPEWSAEEVKSFVEAIQKNEGYCPCSLDKDSDTKCPCKDFRKMKKGTCYCGLYMKEEN